ncbi:MAG: class I adenylate-forming enzyme family protein [Gammaproteobacteria bacterium]|jgi:long-chain acyl-CoA synthetase|nr:class I adenylate-forming enzyme family protein [Gammaproteobacteria bacterium]|tara:strand:- start:156 stop:1886 length:1731 start_codon:yes stop_codon:yes gene_type:complete
MLSDEEILADLEKLKTIVAAHKAANAPHATKPTLIDGQELETFSNIPRNLSQLYDLGTQAGERDFLVYQKERYSFAGTVRKARQMARVLKEDYNIHYGDRVSICARNSPEWCLSYMAITILGGVVVPMNSWWQGPEIEYGLRDSGSKLLIADSPRLNQIASHLDDLAINVILIKPEANSKYAEFYGLIEDRVPLSDTEINEINIEPEANASIMYTSGSTGHPKGVLSTHRNILNALYTWNFVKEVNEILRPELLEENPLYEPAILANVPLFHVTGSHAQFLASFVYLRKFVMMYKWNADQALEIIERERISILHGVPTMAWEVMQSEKFAETDLSSLRGVQSGGAPRPPEHLNLILEKFPAKAIPGLGYGLTETNAIGAIISGAFYSARPNSTGRPTPPVTTVKIVDEQDNDLANEQIGEICIKGPTIMKGYWNKPEATAEVIKDGWFHTGDIGKLDTLGFLIILDRAKDIVIRGGENIGCAEVEYAIAEHRAVNEVSVYGIPDERLGEILCASIMLMSNAKLSAEELNSFLRTKIAGFKIPEKIFFQYEQLPRIASGKIAKKELRQQTLVELSII